MLGVINSQVIQFRFRYAERQTVSLWQYAI